jgi:hypothetical protein
MCRVFHRYHALPLLAITLVVTLACGGTKPAPDGEIVATIPEELTTNAGTVEAQPAKSLDGPALTSEGSGLQLLESVIRQNSAARENIHSLYVDYSWRQDQTFPEMPMPGGRFPGGRLTEEVTSEVWQEDGKFRQDRSRHRTWHDTGVTVEERYIVVLGDTYFIEYHELPKIVMVHYFDNDNQLREPMSLSAGGPSTNLLNFGFGLARGTVEELYRSSMSSHPGYFRWSSERETDGDEHFFRITKTADVQGDSYLAAEILVAADRGFLATEFRNYARDGTLVDSMDCDLQEIQEDIWFPMTVNTSADDSYSTLQIEVKEARVNGDIDDSVFTLHKMDFDPTDVVLTEYAPGGRSKKRKAFWNGQWIPIGMIPRAERPRPQDVREIMEQLGAQFD